MSRPLVALACGILFGVGLAVSQMINPEKILAFLDIAGDWDPSLALVMGGAVGVTLVTFRWVLRLPRPVLDRRFAVPSKKAIDAPLIAGAMIFGVGWGIAGYCPGPAIAGLTIGSWEPPVFVASLIAGNWIASRIGRFTNEPAPSLEDPSTTS